MKLSNESSVPVYTISGSASARPLPEWLVRKRKRSLKQDPEFANRIELLQDFEFEEASSCVRVSEDGEWVMSTGTYKPQMHVHYLPHLALSYTRHTNTLNETFILLSSDYSKSLHLQTDRFLEFHTPQGCHYTTRIPRYGRDLKYDRRSTEVLVPSVGVNADGVGEVFRLNLELGRFMKGYEIEVGGDDLTTPGGGALQGGINAGSVNAAAVAEDSHNLLAFGTSIGTVEFWDPRSRSRAAILSAGTPRDAFSGASEITCLEYDRSGLTIASGASDGIVKLYDLRSAKPYLTKDQGFESPIKTITFLTSSSTTSSSAHLNSEPKILTADKKIIKIWHQNDGSAWTSIEPAVDLNCVAWCRDSGMFLTANEGRQQHSFFIPQLGPAPKWCSFLDNLVEEMAESPDDPGAYSAAHRAGEVYDNYKFLSLPQLRALNLDHLVGQSSLLRPYMHGFFVAQQLYEEARLISNPDLWAEQRQKSIRARIEKERESRIRGAKKLAVKVNRRLAERMQEREDKHARRKAQRALKRGAGETEGADDRPTEDAPADEAADSTAAPALVDPRFAQLFQDEDFAVDEQSSEFALLNPSTKPRGLTAVEAEAASDAPGRSSDSNSESESDSDSDVDAAQQRKVAAQKAAANGRPNKFSTASYRKSGARQQRQREREAAAPRMTASYAGGRRVESSGDKSFEARASEAAAAGGGPRRDTKRRVGGGVVGEKEVSWAPRGSKKGGGRVPDEGVSRGGGSKNWKDRRSASNNTFRGL